MAQAERLCRWWREDAMPFWLERAWDARHGGFYESLTLEGDGVYGDTRRVRTQARQVYVFARAQFEGWAESLDQAEAGMARLRKVAHAPDGQPGWVHTLDDKGGVESDTRDLYDHAFILLSQAWLFRASGNSDYLDQANALLDFLDTDMTAQGAGYRESIGGALTPRRQNPHMHLFEALLSLYEASGDPAHLRRLEHLFGLFSEVFFRPRTGLLYEFFAEDWGALDGDQWQAVEPGHMAEWVWLLSEYARLADTPLPKAADTLWQAVAAQGIDARTNAVFTATDAAGTVRAGGSRCWMQTEWVRAAAVRVLYRRHAGGQAFEQAVGSLFDHHLSPAMAGSWVDSIDANGQAASPKIPTSTLYHVAGAVAEAGRVLAMPESARE